jgi:hypothetical protein
MASIVNARLQIRQSASMRWSGQVNDRVNSD